MKLSPAGKAVCEYFEGRRYLSYPDPGTGGDPWTIAIGHTGPEVKPGLRWTDEQIDAAFAADVAQFERDVLRLLRGHSCTQGQFDALCLFAFNVGSDIDSDDIAEGLGDSTLLKKFLLGDVDGAAAEFLRWNRSGGRVMLGLTRRRMAEKLLFEGATAARAIAEAAMLR